MSRSGSRPRLGVPRLNRRPHGRGHMLEARQFGGVGRGVSFSLRYFWPRSAAIQVNKGKNRFRDPVVPVVNGGMSPSRKLSDGLSGAAVADPR
jgi:hypothetical protein